MGLYHLVLNGMYVVEWNVVVVVVFFVVAYIYIYTYSVICLNDFIDFHEIMRGFHFHRDGFARDI